MILSNPPQSSHVGLYTCVYFRPSVNGGGTKLEVWLESNDWLRVCVHDTILAQNNYCTKPNPDTDAHSGSWVRNRLGYWAPQSTL